MTASAALRADIVVAGGGTAGAVVAGLLAGQSGMDVLLIEAGPDYGSFAGGAWPEDVLDARNLCDSHGWGYDSGSTYPNRVVPFARARMLGGCSSHNGCAAIWGHRADYDAWEAAGCTGWSADALLPHFRSVNERLSVRIPPLEEVQPFQRDFLDAAVSFGIPLVDDLNDLDEPVGVAPSPANVRGGVRWNSAFGYIDPVRDRPNLRILPDTLVDRVLIASGRVTGVSVVRNGRVEVIETTRIVLSGGAYGSPAILLRSGVGDSEVLAKTGIHPVHDLPGVGQNLHDHPAIDMAFEGSEELTGDMTRFMESHWLPEEQVIAKAQSSQCTEAFDLHLYPAGGPYRAGPNNWEYTLNVACMTPRSRGRLQLRAYDPDSAPDLQHGYLTDVEEHDLAVLCDGVAMTRELVAGTEAARRYGAELAPGPAVSTPSEIRTWIRDNVAHYYHPVGTCTMGTASDPLAVVDHRGAVHGIEGLYVADCSIIPVIPRANTNIPAAVIGEKIASSLLPTL